MGLLQNIDNIRKDFPILKQEVNGRPLAYLDNGATSQSPRQVIEASRAYYEEYNSNIHRGTHKLARIATQAHEHARETIAKYVHAKHSEEVIFTSGTTDSINLVANIVDKQLSSGDEILISTHEHHSNIVPWQMLCQRTGAQLRVIPMLDSGLLDLSNIDEIINPNTKILSITHVSNALGVINPVSDLIKKAKAHGAITIIDGAQAIPHLAIDVTELGSDFYVFSAHKVYAPTGIGILWGRKELLELLPPWRGGGEMIKQVTFEKTTYNTLPFKYEAGTPNIEGGIALAAAFNWVSEIGIDNITSHEHALQTYATSQLREIENIHIYADVADKAGVISFNIKNVHHYDLGSLIDQMGVAVRTGHHCCQPLMQRLDITGTVRASFAVYNTTEECDQLVHAVKKASMMLS